MTGGQTSGLTPPGFHTTTSASGSVFEAYDICALAHSAGSNYVCRILGVGDISDKLAIAFGTKGFSLAEVVEICPGFGMKLNPKRKLVEIVEESGKLPGEWLNSREKFKWHPTKVSDNLFEKTPEIKREFRNYLKKSMSVIISGSAGEGIQLAATLLSKAAVRSGLSVSQKGIYPVTVGVGFSTAEVTLSPRPIYFHGISIPEVAIITSEDGLAHNSVRISKMDAGMLFIDESLKAPQTNAKIIEHNFRNVGARNAAIYAVIKFALETGIICTESVFKTIEQEGLQKKLSLARIKEALVK